jgi:hypothetical protein
MYSWMDVSIRTEKVYQLIAEHDLPSLAERFARCANFQTI